MTKNSMVLQVLLALNVAVFSILGWIISDENIAYVEMFSLSVPIWLLLTVMLGIPTAWHLSEFSELFYMAKKRGFSKIKSYLLPLFRVWPLCVLMLSIIQMLSMEMSQKERVVAFFIVCIPLVLVRAFFENWVKLNLKN